MKLIHVSKTDVGRVRPANEDSIGSIIKNIGIYSNVYIVCDGMGGHVGGARASQTAIRSIDEYFKGTPDPTPNIALKTAIEFANMQIFGDAQANPEYKGMGTTVTLMVESNGLLYIAHVGDSRIYINTDRELFRVTKDHSFVQNLVDAGQLTDAEMETHKRKNELTRALGIAMDVDVEVAPQPIRAKKGDKFLLCSDGLCGLINDSMISATINTYSDLNAAVDELIQLANNAGGHDNISADLIEVIESDFVKTSYENKNNVSNSNTGTQEVKLPIEPAKPKMDKKLQIILSLVGLIAFVVCGILFFDRSGIKEGEDTTTVKSDQEIEVIDISFEDKLHKLNPAENYNEELDIIYSSLTSENGERWDFKSFIDAIKLKNYKKIENSDDQKFYIAKDSEIIDLADARKSYKSGEKIFEEGDLIYIEVRNLIKKVNRSIVYDQTDQDIVTNVINLIKAGKRKKLSSKQKQGCTVTFYPKKPPKATVKKQLKKVKVKVSKGSVVETFEFNETIAPDKNLVKEHNNTIINNFLKTIISRDYNIQEAKIKKLIVTFKPETAPDATHKDENYDYDVIVKLAGLSESKQLTETIKASQAKIDEHKIDELKNQGWENKYAWHDLESDDCLSDVDSKPFPSTILCKYSSAIKTLNDMYEKEKKYKSNEYKDYNLKTEPCSDQIYLFSYEKQLKFRSQTQNQFTQAQINIIKGCTGENYPIKMCPPNTIE
jgi:serine/threonine protein phosphatase PrpC